MSFPLRLVRTHARSLLSLRCLATATVQNPGVLASSSASAVIPLSNVEAQWERLTSDEQLCVQQQLEELQKKDWKTLSLDEKKAAYYVAFGPHGPRTPLSQPGTSLKVLVGTSAAILAAAALFYSVRAMAPPPPKTMSTEWQEAMNERAREQKMNPISGISSEGYSGKGFVTK